MLKKLLTVAIVLVAIGTTGTVGYTANGDDTTNKEEVSIINEQPKTGNQEIKTGNQEIKTGDQEVKTENKEVNVGNEEVGTENEEQKELEIVGPEDKKTTTNNIVLISGIGKQGTNVIVEVYSTVSINKDAFSLDNLPKDDEYILFETHDLEISSLGSFAKELELEIGLYKIVFSTKKDDVVEVKATRYIQIKDIEEVKEALENISGSKTKPSDTNIIQSPTE